MMLHKKAPRKGPSYGFLAFLKVQCQDALAISVAFVPNEQVSCFSMTASQEDRRAVVLMIMVLVDHAKLATAKKVKH